MLFFVFYNGFFYNPAEHYKPLYDLIENQYVFKHLDVKRNLIDELLLSNNSLENILKAKQGAVSTDYDKVIKTLLELDQATEIMVGNVKE